MNQESDLSFQRRLSSGCEKTLNYLAIPSEVFGSMCAIYLIFTSFHVLCSVLLFVTLKEDITLYNFTHQIKYYVMLYVMKNKNKMAPKVKLIHPNRTFEASCRVFDSSSELGVKMPRVMGRNNEQKSDMYIVQTRLYRLTVQLHAKYTLQSILAITQAIGASAVWL